MVVLEKVRVADSTRPVLGPREVEHCRVAKVDVNFTEPSGFDESAGDRFDGGELVVTSHRVVWLDSEARPGLAKSFSLPLAAVYGVEVRASHIWTAQKLRLYTHIGARNEPARGPATRTTQIKIISSQQQELLKWIQHALSQRSWERDREVERSWAPLQQSLLAGVDPVQLSQLRAMGFPEPRAARALAATNSAGVEVAVNWLLSNSAAPGLDDPLPAPVAGLPPAPSPAPQHSGPCFSTSAVGVARLLEREERVAASNDRTMEAAFKDLRALMASAAEMVTLAEHFRLALAAATAGQGSGDGGEGELAMDAQLQQDLVDMGIASPVTRHAAGAQYHHHLSRQLSDFLAPRVEKAGGLMTLPDAYCLFNRARGTELISPDDLLAAAQQFPDIAAPLHLRRLRSGVLVVQAAAHSEDQVCAKLAEMAGAEGLGNALSASDVARALALPLAIAAEHLLTAEARGVLCRDDAPEDLRFFRNFFLDAAFAAAA